MDVTELSRWGWLLVLVINLFTGWITWTLQKKFMTRDDCTACQAGMRHRQAALEESLQAVSTRQAALEAVLEGLPTARDMQGFALSLAELRGDMKTQTALMTRVEKVVDLLRETHMEPRK